MGSCRRKASGANSRYTHYVAPLPCVLTKYCWMLENWTLTHLQSYYMQKDGFISVYLQFPPEQGGWVRVVRERVCLIILHNTRGWIVLIALHMNTHQSSGNEAWAFQRIKLCSGKNLIHQKRTMVMWGERYVWLVWIQQVHYSWQLRHLGMITCCHDAECSQMIYSPK